MCFYLRFFLSLSHSNNRRYLTWTMQARTHPISCVSPASPAHLPYQLRPPRTAVLHGCPTPARLLCRRTFMAARSPCQPQAIPCYGQERLDSLLSWSPRTARHSPRLPEFPVKLSNAIIASDKLNNTIFYAASGSQFFVSTDGGLSFNQTATLGTSTSPVRIAVSPFETGELFVSSDKGVWHSTNSGSSLFSIPGPTAAWSISVGKAASSTSPVSLFAAAQIYGINSMYRTDDLGQNWARLSTAQDGLGPVDFMVLAADPNVYSQVFAGIGGRGIFYGHS